MESFINTVICGRCEVVLKDFPDNSVDALVTDPPYGLKFMNKKWDCDVPGVEIWKEIFRVLKPGAHILCFAGTRTYHRMVCNIEDSGFIIRDMIQWLYGSGFPKNMDVSKAIDKQAGAKRETIRTVRAGFGKRNGIKDKDGGIFQNSLPENLKQVDVTAPATDQAKQWDGWGTALKPANEPICLAMKPISEKTIADNVLKWGTGGINIDESRVGDYGARFNGRKVDSDIYGKYGTAKPKEDYNKGRWPANIILDEEAGEMLDEQSGQSKSSSGFRGLQNSGRHGGVADLGDNIKEGTNSIRGHSDSGGASRFFYCPKASQEERNIGLEDLPERTTDDGRKKTNDTAYQRGKTLRRNNHPTVKPLELMRYLVRMITPPGGIVLDSFFGSGTTGMAAVKEGFDYIGIEESDKDCEMSRLRIAAMKREKENIIVEAEKTGDKKSYKQLSLEV